MTKREKIKILEVLKKALIHGDHAGFCSAYSQHVDPCNAEPKLLELGLQKPRKTVLGYHLMPFWYKPYYHKTRIRKIDELIKRLR